MPARRPSLDDLRRDIDEIDDAIHDLLMKRAEIGRRVREAKGAGGPIFRPGREARILRRLLERHDGPFPARVVMRIWREIVSAFAVMQGPFSVAVYSPEEGVDLAGLAREHFGSASPLRGFAADSSVLRAVSEGEATLGVLPLPARGESDCWWRSLARDDKARPRIVARLPFVGPARDGGGPEALVVGLMAPEPSGDDLGYLIVETREPLSRGRLRELLESAGFEILDSSVSSESEATRLHLIEVAGYLSEDDPRLSRVTGPGQGGRQDDAQEGPIARIWTAGGYARPLAATRFADDEAKAEDSP